MSVQKSKNDTAWEELFSEHHIVSDVDTHGVCRITAAAINKKREARLMTKFDHIVNLPKIFSDNGLAILPDSRSSYVIGRFNCYAKLDQDPTDPIIDRTFPDWMQSLTSSNLYSESAALLCAQHAELISEIVGEELALTVFGRMSTGEFDFSIHATQGGVTVQQPLTIDRAQCEIDGGFEGPETFAIVEVKNQEVEDFHIRQLYYPYRLWRGKLQSKRVVPIFLTYSNEIFTFSVYEFERPEEYNSLQLVKRKRYQIVPTEIEIADIRLILSQTRAQAEPTEPFPQADRFERVIDLLTRLRAAGGTMAQDDITTEYAFNIRQTQYYSGAARYLGLLDNIRESGGASYTLTAAGTQLMNKAPKARNLALIEVILSRPVFRSAVEYYFAHSFEPSKGELISMMQKAGLSINQTTGERRAQTVLCWVRWIIGLTNE